MKLRSPNAFIFCTDRWEGCYKQQERGLHAGSAQQLQPGAVPGHPVVQEAHKCWYFLKDSVQQPLRGGHRLLPRTIGDPIRIAAGSSENRAAFRRRAEERLPQEAPRSERAGH